MVIQNKQINPQLRAQRIQREKAISTESLIPTSHRLSPYENPPPPPRLFPQETNKTSFMSQPFFIFYSNMLQPCHQAYHQQKQNNTNKNAQNERSSTSSIPILTRLNSLCTTSRVRLYSADTWRQRGELHEVSRTESSALMSCRPTWSCAALFCRRSDCRTIDCRGGRGEG